MSLCTEDEARERWCPFVRASIVMNDGVHAANRYAEGGNHPNANCIASQCMQWRWQPLQADEPFLDAVKKRMDDAKETHPKAVKYVRAHLAELGLPDKPFRGYCGRAGKP